jgi:hypothetical protein
VPSNSSRAYRWATELKKLPSDEMHSKLSEFINNMLNEGDTYTTFRTISTLLLECHLDITLKKLWNYDRVMTELDNVIQYQKHDNSMFVPYDPIANI